MNLQLYNNKSEQVVINKTIEAVGSPISGVFHAETGIMNPSFEIRSDDTPAANYCFVPEIGRYYFITNISSIRNGLWLIECHEDVLETYKLDILAQKAIVSRSENKWNIYGSDGAFKTYQNPHILTKTFPNGFPAPTYILTVAGG